MPTGTQDGRKRLYLDFDGYFAAVEEQAAPAQRAVRMRMPLGDVVAAAGTGEKDGQRAFQVFAIGLTIGVPVGEDGSTFATMAGESRGRVHRIPSPSSTPLHVSMGSGPSARRRRIRHA